MKLVEKAIVPSTTVRQSRFVEIGNSGLKHYNGMLEEEFLRELRGPEGVKVYNEMSKNDGVIGASLFAYSMLAKGVDFRVDPANDSGAKGEAVAEFINDCLFNDMSTSWRDLLGEILSMLTYGWSYFEVVYKRREGSTSDATTNSRFRDGKIGWRKWAPRAQNTLYRWELDENGGIQGMVQRASPHFVEQLIPIEKSLLFRTIIERGNPEGQSILRTAYPSFYQKRRVVIVRGIGIERDLAGLPMLTPPEGVDIWNPNDAAAVAKKVAAEKLVRNIRRDEHEGILKPFGWELELLSSGGARQFDVQAVIAQLNAEMAMSMMTDFVLIGHEKVGARSLSMDKRATFSHAAESFLDNICEVINRFAIPRLVALNGWDAELSPKLEHGPVAELELEQLMSFLDKAGSGGFIFPDKELELHLRKRAQLPPPPDDIDESRYDPQPAPAMVPGQSPNDSSTDENKNLPQENDENVPEEGDD